MGRATCRHQKTGLEEKMQTILVVEDDHDLNQSIGYSLKKSGYAVCGVTSIEKAKQMFNRNQIDLILLDVNLPDGEGFSFCRWVKAKREVPVMYLTARDMEEDALAGYDSGAEDYVIKPFSMKVLLKKIDIILKRAVLSKRMIFTDEYREKNNIKKGQEYKNTKGSKIEQRLFYLSQILSLYNDIKESYPELNEKQISEQLDFNPSTIRRYKREKELLTNLREKDMEK